MSKNLNQYIRPKNGSVLAFSDGDDTKEIKLDHEFSYGIVLEELRLICVFDENGSKSSFDLGKVYDLDGRYCFNIPYPTHLNIGNEVELFFNWCSFSHEGLNIIFSTNKVTIRDFTLIYDLKNRVYKNSDGK